MHRLAQDSLQDDESVVTGQLGRQPRSPWRVVTRCGFSRPSVIASPPVLDDGTPFPTLYWLTCPWLMERVGEFESAGETSAWATRIAEDPELAHRLDAADARYRELRAAEGGGVDACAGVGIAGQREPGGTKCLHAHVATRLAGVDDPIGESVLAAIPQECDDDRCAPGPDASGETP